MGTSDDIHRDDAHQTYQYVLGERTWIEYWPIEAECQADEHRPTCLGMEEMRIRIRRMRKTLLWLLASLAFVSLTSLADGAPFTSKTACGSFCSVTSHSH
ncbi:hypothetical protein F7725_016145 [Dissostichus mawsoni]|uniref:Netrin module non-TIMP type domain-containing protein n=1 Tax=Dissostichus mawsoni TaxID=36200 RepID=A0A7J5Y631_DISMA|nr:hypothetical protein F7725_016145 [Dissostichus mawsoni]